MASRCIILAIIIVAMRGIHAQQQQLVPCFFPFGDSIFDNGNNNDLISLAKANYLPYGIDFFYGPTGRFSNGLLIPDFLAEKIGFSTRVPPFATAGGSNTILRGLNYASASAGILDETSLQVGQRFSMNQQLQNHQTTVNQIETKLGNETAAKNLLQKCLYVISIGNNDYLNNYYYLPITLTRILYTPEKFAERLIKQYSQQLTTLYNLHARKVAVFGVAPLGCLPQEVFLFPSNGSDCVGFINDAVQSFNKKLVSIINNFNTIMPGANFTYINTYNILSNFETTLGITVPRSPCCEVNRLLGICARNGGVCSNRDEYSYFDNFHPTQIVYNYTTSRAFVAESPSDATPYDIRTLINR